MPIVAEADRMSAVSKKQVDHCRVVCIVSNGMRERRRRVAMALAKRRVDNVWYDGGHVE